MIITQILFLKVKSMTLLTHTTQNTQNTHFIFWTITWSKPTNIKHLLM